MTRTMYVDEYCCIDVFYLVPLCKVDPCADCDDDHGFLLAGVLHVATQAIPLQVASPARGHRDAAFEAIVALVKREQARAVFEEED